MGMEKAILIILIYLGILLNSGCLQDKEMNNVYDKIEVGIVKDFVFSKSLSIDSIFVVSSIRRKNVIALYISKHKKPVQAVADFNIDSIGDKKILFYSGEQLKELSNYEKHTKEGVVNVGNIFIDESNVNYNIIVYCLKNRSKEIFQKEEYLKIINGEETKFLDNFCE